MKMIVLILLWVAILGLLLLKLIDTIQSKIENELKEENNKTTEREGKNFKMRKKEIIESLRRENELLRYLNGEQEKEIEILEFKVKNGANPVDFFDTGDIRIMLGKNDQGRCEGYKVKYITVMGDMDYLSLGYLSAPRFEIKRNDKRECIFTICENNSLMLRWFKLFKDRKIVVEIPEPSFALVEVHEACRPRGDKDE